MPWTASRDLVPDIIMNPHALPSRMTINQLMETVLGKSCVMEGESLVMLRPSPPPALTLLRNCVIDWR